MTDVSDFRFIDLEAFINQVKAEAPIFDSRVEVAWTQDPLEDFSPDNVPFALVYPGLQYSAPRSDMPTARQQVFCEINVIFVCKTVNLADVINELRFAVLGYQQNEKWEMTHFMNRGERPFGTPLNVKGEFIAWQEIYQTSYHQRTTRN